MTAVVLILFVLFVYGAKVSGFGKFWPDYASRGRSTGLKGIFVMFVILSHFFGYVETGRDDALAARLVSGLGQLMVTPFLFYSGFGAMESIAKKGESYIRAIPVHRALKTLLHFDLAVLLFFALNGLLGRHYSPVHMLQALLCWQSVGNSAWYIFTMIALYLITAAAFSLFPRDTGRALAAVTAGSVVLVLILIPLKDDWWYNTVFCYVLGMIYARLRPSVEACLFRNDFFYGGGILMLGAAFAVLWRLRWYSSWVYQVLAMVFVLLLVLMTMKLRLDNAFLQFLGKHTFSIYILQRLPMLYFSEKGLLAGKTVMLFLVCLGITFVLAVGFDWATGKADRWIFRKK